MGRLPSTPPPPAMALLECPRGESAQVMALGSWACGWQAGVVMKGEREGAIIRDGGQQLRPSPPFLFSALPLTLIFLPYISPFPNLPLPLSLHISLPCPSLLYSHNPS